MKHFLKKLLLFSFVCYGLLWGLQLIVDYGLKNLKSGVYGVWHDMYSGKVNADVLVVGSSRALRHFDPEILESKLGGTAYNIGGNNLYFDLQEIRTEAYLAHNKPPKIVLINVDINSLLVINELYDKYQYLPYYSIDNYKILSRFDNKILSEYLLPMYKYRNHIKQVQDGFGNTILNIKPKEAPFKKGYSPEKNSWDLKAEKELKDNRKILKKNNTDKLLKNQTVLNKRIAAFLNIGTEVFLVWSPEHTMRQQMETTAMPIIKNSYRNLAAENDHVHFLDFTQHPINDNKAYFYNSFHLNEKGATIFSAMLADSIALYRQRK